MVSKKVVLADVPPERKPERGYVRMFPWNENRNEGTFGCSPGTKNRNEGTFACSPGTKTGTRAHSPKPPFYETALLSSGDSKILKTLWRSKSLSGSVLSTTGSFGWSFLKKGGPLLVCTFRQSCSPCRVEDRHDYEQCPEEA